MKSKILVMFFALIALTLSAQMPRSEWHAKVGECALDPVVLKSTISQLSSGDKVAFIAEINEAISKMPGSAEVKAAQFLAINRAAVRSVGSADRVAALAEVFATVPPESLAVINEEFAKSEFSRPSSMDAERFTRIVKSVMAKIVQRCASSESGAVRSCFAGLMFVRAAGDAAEAAQAAVVSALPADAQLEARNNWIPAALGKEQTQSYDPMLAAAQAGEEPEHSTVISIYSAQIVESMLADLQAGALPETKASGSLVATPATDFFNGDTDAMAVKMSEIPHGRVLNPIIPKFNVTLNPADKDIPVENPWFTDGRKGDREPGPYPWQLL
jgi:hypothetical protein